MRLSTVELYIIGLSLEKYFKRKEESGLQARTIIPVMKSCLPNANTSNI